MNQRQLESAQEAIGSGLYAITQALRDDSYEQEERAAHDLGLAETWLLEAISGAATEDGEASEIFIYDALRELREGVKHLVEARRRLEAWERTHGI